MNTRLSEWWHSLMSVGQPVFPYVGLVLLILLGVLALIGVLYLLYKFIHRLPPILRYLFWRISAGLRRVFARQATPQQQLVMAHFVGDRNIFPLERSFSSQTRWAGWWGERRPRVPLFLVLGPSGSGKTALLSLAANTTLAGLTTSSAHPAAQADVTWWRLRERLGMEVDARLLLDSMGQKFHHLLRQLKQQCPDRPLDGLVVTLPAEYLLNDNAEQAQELSRLAEALAQILTVSGHAIAFYVVITGAETLTGFEQLVHILPDNAQLSHSVKAPLDQTDMDQVTTAWSSAIRAQVLGGLVAAHEPTVFGQFNPVLSFPGEVSRLKAALATWLKQLSTRTMQAQSVPLFRGIYLTGLTTSEANEPVVSLKFLQEAARSTLFSEAHLAKPTLRHISMLRRRVAGVAGGLLASVLILAVGMPVALSNLQKNAQTVLAVLEQNKADAYDMVRPPAGGGAAKDPARLARLLRAVSVTADSSLTTVLAPSSWFDTTLNNVLSLLGDITQRWLVVPRLEELAQDTPRAPPEALVPMAGVSAERIEYLPGYTALLDFLSTRELFSDAMQTVNELERHITYADFAKFLGEDPTRVQSAGWHWSERMPKTVVHRFDTELLRRIETNTPAVQQLVLAYWDRLQNEALDLNPVVVLSEEISTLVAKLVRGQNFGHQDAMDLSDRLRRLQREAIQPGARRLLGKPSEAMNFLGPILTRLGSSSVVSLVQTTEMSGAFTKRREALRNRLMTYEIDGVGRVFIADAAEGTIALSPEVKKFAASYAGFVLQPFMQSNGLEDRGLDRFASGVTWNLSELQAVKNLAAAYREYTTTGIAAFDATLRAGLLRLSQAQFRTSLDTLYLRAARPAREFDGTGIASGEPLAALRFQVDNLAQAAKLYRQAVSVDEELGVAGTLLVGEVTRLLTQLEARLTMDDPYSAIILDVHRWMASPSPGRPLGNTLRGNPKERLALARDYVRTQYAVPVALLLDSLNSVSSTATRAEVVQRWRRFMDALEGFDKGVTANGLYEFEQYILSLSKWADPDECERFLADRAPIPWRSDYFSGRLAALDAPVAQACTDRTTEGQRSKYETFANWFNEQVAGHSPFGQGQGLAPLSRRNFSTLLSRYRDLRKQIPVLPQDWPQGVGQFFLQMDSLVERFMPKERNKTSTTPAGESVEGTVQARLQLRAPRGDAVLADQVIDSSVLVGGRQYGLRNSKETFEWHIGEPIEVRLRWAANSPYAPVAGQDGKNRYTVKERTVTFRQDGDWAFFDLVNKYLVRGDGYEQSVLRFPVDVVGPQGRSVAQIFIVFSSSSERMPLALDFPHRAPSLLMAAEDSYVPFFKSDKTLK